MFGPGTFGSETVTALSLISRTMGVAHRAAMSHDPPVDALGNGSCSRNETRKSSPMAMKATRIRSMHITPMSHYELSRLATGKGGKDVAQIQIARPRRTVLRRTAR
jgi:hypothetical protein